MSSGDHDDGKHHEEEGQNTRGRKRPAAEGSMRQWQRLFDESSSSESERAAEARNAPGAWAWIRQKLFGQEKPALDAANADQSNNSPDTAAGVDHNAETLPATSSGVNQDSPTDMPSRGQTIHTPASNDLTASNSNNASKRGQQEEVECKCPELYAKDRPKVHFIKVMFVEQSSSATDGKERTVVVNKRQRLGEAAVNNLHRCCAIGRVSAGAGDDDMEVDGGNDASRPADRPRPEDPRQVDSAGQTVWDHSLVSPATRQPAVENSYSPESYFMRGSSAMPINTAVGSKLLGAKKCRSSYLTCGGNTSTYFKGAETNTHHPAAVRDRVVDDYYARVRKREEMARHDRESRQEIIPEQKGYQERRGQRERDRLSYPKWQQRHTDAYRKQQEEQNRAALRSENSRIDETNRILGRENVAQEDLRICEDEEPMYDHRHRLLQARDQFPQRDSEQDFQHVGPSRINEREGISDRYKKFLGRFDAVNNIEDNGSNCSGTSQDFRMSTNADSHQQNDIQSKSYHQVQAGNTSQHVEETRGHQDHSDQHFFSVSSSNPKDPNFYGKPVYSGFENVSTVVRPSPGQHIMAINGDRCKCMGCKQKYKRRRLMEDPLTEDLVVEEEVMVVQDPLQAGDDADCGCNCESGGTMVNRVGLPYTGEEMFSRRAEDNQPKYDHPDRQTQTYRGGSDVEENSKPSSSGRPFEPVPSLQSFFGRSIQRRMLPGPFRLGAANDSSVSIGTSTTDLASSGFSRRRLMTAESLGPVGPIVRDLFVPCNDPSSSGQQQNRRDDQVDEGEVDFSRMNLGGNNGTSNLYESAEERNCNGRLSAGLVAESSASDEFVTDFHSEQCQFHSRFGGGSDSRDDLADLPCSRDQAGAVVHLETSSAAGHVASIDEVTGVKKGDDRLGPAGVFGSTARGGSGASRTEDQHARLYPPTTTTAGNSGPRGARDGAMEPPHRGTVDNTTIVVNSSFVDGSGSMTGMIAEPPTSWSAFRVESQENFLVNEYAKAALLQGRSLSRHRPGHHCGQSKSLNAPELNDAPVQCKLKPGNELCANSDGNGLVVLARKHSTVDLMRGDCRDFVQQPAVVVDNKTDPNDVAVDRQDVENVRLAGQQRQGQQRVERVRRYRRSTTEDGQGVHGQQLMDDEGMPNADVDISDDEDLDVSDKSQQTEQS